MTCFFRIHREQYDLRGPKRAQNFDVDGCSHFIIFKSFKTFKSLRFVWWRMLLLVDLRNPPVEWMTRLFWYYEHLVLPGRSVLGKRNCFGPKFVNWLTRLCATQTISSGVMRTQCVLQIPKACKKMSLACSLRWRVDVSVAHYIQCIVCVVWLALFARVCALEGTAWGYITGFPLPSRCGPSNYRTAGVLLHWNYSDTADANFDLTHVKTDKYEGTETIIPTQ